MSTAAATRPATRPAHNMPQHAWEFDAADGRWVDAQTGTPLTVREPRKVAPTRTRRCVTCGETHKSNQTECNDVWTSKGTCGSCYMELPLTGICEDCI